MQARVGKNYLSAMTGQSGLWLACVLFLSLNFMTICQARADQIPENDLQMWLPVTLKAKLDEHVFTYMEVQPRIGNNLVGPTTPEEGEHFSLLLVRPAVGYQVNKTLSLWQGYAWAPSYLPKFRNENRIWQQVMFENKFKREKLNRLTIINRTRLEERWFENSNGTSVRGRHLLRVLYALGKSRKWSLVTSDEYFVNLNSAQNAPKAGFDQNRFFVGFNRKVNDNINMEAGYMLNFVNRADPLADRYNHAILIGVNMLLN